MTEFSTEQPAPQLLAIRNAERNILKTTTLTPKIADSLGRTLVEAQYDYYLLYRQKHPDTALINENIKSLREVLNTDDAGETLRNHLKNRAEGMKLDPAWILRNDEMRDFPDKLMQVADKILQVR